MRKALMIPLLLSTALAAAAACAQAPDGEGAPNPAASPEAQADTPVSPTLTRARALDDKLFGNAPTSPPVVPEFQVSNLDGTPRTRADLLGKPTVLWFYPMAGTPG